MVRFHDWRAARDRKAALALPLHRAGGGACLDWACDPGAAGRHVILLHPAAHRDAEVRHRLLTYRIIKEICNAARELAGFLRLSLVSDCSGPQFRNRLSFRCRKSQRDRRESVADRGPGLDPLLVTGPWITLG